MVQTDHPARSKQQCSAKTRRHFMLLHYYPAQWQPLPNRNSSCRSNAGNLTIHWLENMHPKSLIRYASYSVAK